MSSLHWRSYAYSFWQYAKGLSKQKNTNGEGTQIVSLWYRDTNVVAIRLNPSSTKPVATV
jgi:hypothetical protein